MTGKLSPQDKIKRVRSVLLDVAAAKKFSSITYEDLAQLLDFEVGLWSDVLDPVSAEQKKNRLPDITFLVVRKDTLYPGKIDGVPIRDVPSKEQMSRVSEEVDEIIRVYNPGARNYYS